MPKVSAEYFEVKKNAILDTTEKICKTKPLYKLTMKDVIKGTGLSPGAVYASFSDIDEVIIGLINRLSVSVDFESATSEIMKTSNKPEEIIDALLNYLVELIHATITSYGKIFHELNTILSDATRRKKIADEMNEIQMYSFMIDKITGVIKENIASGYFNPIVSEESVYALIFAFFDGLIRDLTLVKCYRVDTPQAVTFEEKDLPKALVNSVIFLLNHNN